MDAQHGSAAGHGVVHVPTWNGETQWLYRSELIQRHTFSKPRIDFAAGCTSLMAERITERESEGTNLKALDA
jgi:hypothetical protein